MSWLFPESLQRDVVEGKWADAVQARGGLLRSPPPPPVALPIRFSLRLSAVFQTFSVSAFLECDFYEGG